MAPRILIFSNAMSADYTFYVKTIETFARAFLTLNILAICRMFCLTDKSKVKISENCVAFSELYEQMTNHLVTVEATLARRALRSPQHK